MRARKQAKKGLTRVAVTLRAAATSQETYQADFIIDTGASESRAPASKLHGIGIKPQGKMTHQLDDGTAMEFHFGVAAIELMGDVTAGRVTFGAEDSEPILGLIAIEAMGLQLDLKTGTLRRQAPIPLKARPRT